MKFMNYSRAAKKSGLKRHSSRHIDAPNAFGGLHCVDADVLEDPSIRDSAGSGNLRLRIAPFAGPPLGLQEKLNADELPGCERVTCLCGASRESNCPYI